LTAQDDPTPDRSGSGGSTWDLSSAELDRALIGGILGLFLACCGAAAVVIFGGLMGVRHVRAGRR